jgi:hypothetical protein
MNVGWLENILHSAFKRRNSWIEKKRSKQRKGRMLRRPERRFVMSATPRCSACRIGKIATPNLLRHLLHLRVTGRIGRLSFEARQLRIRLSGGGGGFGDDLFTCSFYRTPRDWGQWSIPGHSRFLHVARHAVPNDPGERHLDKLGFFASDAPQGLGHHMFAATETVDFWNICTRAHPKQTFCGEFSKVYLGLVNMCFGDARRLQDRVCIVFSVVNVFFYCFP